MNILEEIHNCPVEWKELGEVVDYEQPTKYIVSSKSYADSYEIPVLTAGQSFILGYTNEKDGIYHASKNNPVIIFDDFTTSKQWVDFKFKVKSSAMKMLTIKDEFKNEVLLRYVWHYLGTITYKPDQHGRQWIGTYSKFLVPIPPLKLQEKIVQILDKFTDYVTELTSELTSRKKQYSFYRDKLLSFEDEIYQVEWKSLSEIAKDFGRGKSKHRPRNDARLYGGDIPFIQTGDIREAGKWIENYSQTYSAFGLQQSKQWEKGTLCITIAANIAETGLLGFDACFPDSIIGFVANPKFAITEYVYYYLNSIKDYLANKSYGSAQDNLNLSTFSSLKIPVPSLEIQSRIVQVLDNFDTVCNDLKIGLPKEIELRQKQYEYFRDKLLTFVAEGEYSTVQYRQDLIRLLTWVFGPIRVKLGQVVNLQRGKRLVKKQLTAAGSFPVYQNSLTPLGYFEQSNRVKETSFVICAGAAGEIGYSDTDFWAADDVYTLETSEDISDKFMYYVLLSKQDRLKSQVRKASIPRLSKDAIDKVTFYLPSFTEQERIVSILDNFNTLTTSISEGLPKEIEQRQKQYAYWREQLFNFDL
ncbi:restriction endonuclease subunit S [Streptococcus salivarius]|uniref:restriction endonuclease subunit S n=1 Tax=Streptococcus salivarius TaxID=1304 RepID=UPI0019183457|nr:restriction endonuclease subunit S [Streptococcus salivarius]